MPPARSSKNFGAFVVPAAALCFFVVLVPLPVFGRVAGLGVRTTAGVAGKIGVARAGGVNGTAGAVAGGAVAEATTSMPATSKTSSTIMASAVRSRPRRRFGWGLCGMDPPRKSVL